MPRTITVPADCPTQFGVLSASAASASRTASVASLAVSRSLCRTSGAVRSGFESLRAAKVPASHTVSGNVGAGTGRVSVSTMSGSVTLLRRLRREGKESETR
jgi:hypothetical protein